MSQVILRLENILFSYAEGDPIVNVPSLDIKEGTIHGLAGASGGGKTTLLKILAGLFAPSTGKVLYQNERLPDPREMLIRGYKPMALVQQDFDLRPRYTVRQNVEEPLRRYARNTRTQKADDLLKLAGLEDFEGQLAMNLSGGQRQRLAIIRAVAAEPEVLLLDEPFSQMDLNNKQKLKELIIDLNKSEGTTILLTTHEVSEIMSMADIITVIRYGEVLGSDTPSKHYFKPKSEYIARLFGECNWMEPEESNRYLSLPSEKRVLIRPNQIILSESGISALVAKSEFLGAYWRLEVKDQYEKIWLVYSCQGISKKEVFLSGFDTHE